MLLTIYSSVQVYYGQVKIIEKNMKLEGFAYGVFFVR